MSDNVFKHFSIKDDSVKAVTINIPDGYYCNPKSNKCFMMEDMRPVSGIRCYMFKKYLDRDDNIDIVYKCKECLSGKLL